ncbi:GH92 family glycosyl hydrolase [Nonomuraea endophytica]|uniref:Putative alpha-1,2-mannosidase n=1 Tax=Nonomuraea endophytica TaxID=714136 RepID=A0A7W8ACV3_9ACTN|nr:GH92 family glycosyl hydrolase [Nonomuraea endophytica]MBB5082761.1 putative alpha-1,2-mannosidase [Nonomuraea endophytica]
MSQWSLPIVSALLVSLAIPPGATAQTPQTDPAALVNVFHGTKEAAPDFGHGGGGGMTFPGAVLPFGMMQWSPDTVREAGGGYAWEDNRLRGFSMTHISGPGCNGAQDFPIMPFSGVIGRSPATNGWDYVQTFKHENEKGRPGSYSATLDSGVGVELAATTRAGVGRFSFPTGKPGTVLLNTSGSINGVDDGETRVSGNTVEGWIQTGGFCGPPMRYKVYFHATFDRPVTAYGTWKNDTVTPGAASVKNNGPARVANAETVGDGDVVTSGPGSGAYLQFDPGQPVQMRVGLSYVSLDGARKNLAAEVGTQNLGQISDQGFSAWNKRLGQIRVTGGGEDRQRTFYSNLYHALLQPHVADDVDGQYPGFDHKPKQVRPGRHHYALFSGWDIYRSEVQLIALLDPVVGADIAQSMYDNAQAVGNVWDRWSHQIAITGVMVGDPYHSILASMYAFGARDFDAQKAVQAMAEAARRVGPQDIGSPLLGYDERPGNAAYMSQGYVPIDPATTLEYTVADFGIAQLASRLGQTQIAQEFTARSQNWQNLYNPANAWIQPRAKDGSFVSPFDPASMQLYVEGNGAQYHWMVPHNVRGLFTVMGGNAQVLPRLDAFFKKLNAGPHEPYAYLGNEPSLATPWLYAWAGRPYRTQELVRRVQQDLFKSGPDGLVGNDDLGAMGSWYVWSAMGLFPAIPGRAELMVNTPLFDSVTVTRPQGTITVSAPGAAANPYVQTLRVNGTATGKAWLPESFAQQGGRLDFTLGAKPNTQFGSETWNAPPSFGDGVKPYLAGLSPGSGPVEPGGSFSSELAVQSSGRAQTLAWTAKAPAGITVTPASGTLRVPAGGRATQKVVISVSPGMATGFQEVAFKAGDVVAGEVSAGVRLNVAQRGTVAWAQNGAGVGDPDHPGIANLDGFNFSYSNEGLAANGFVPGQPYKWKEFEFTWPDRKPGEWDHLRVGSGPVEVKAPAGASKVAFLGSATFGYPEVDVTITYTDGTTGSGKLGFSDWILNFSSAQPQHGNEIVARLPNRLFGGSWAFQPIPSYLFAAQPIALDPSKQVRSLTFGPVPEGAMHLFTWAFA